MIIGLCLRCFIDYILIMKQTPRYFNTIPKTEKILGKIFLRLHGFKSWDDICAEFETNCDTILDIYVGVPPEKAVKQIKIERPRFLEESSTNWSAVMLLNHLIQVGTNIIYIQQSFIEDRPFKHTVRTQDVKPPIITDERATTTIIDQFEKLKKDYLELTKNEIISNRTVEHPWFGAMESKKWHSLSAIHIDLHTKQLATILRKA